MSVKSFDPLINRVYANRGINGPAELDYALKHLPKPDLLTGMDQACWILYEAALADARILIVGDYDVDGATSTALTKRCLEAFGFQHLAYFIPDRMHFGYGLSPEVVDVIQDYQADVLITVDNGITSHEGVKKAHEYGISVIITDHHLPAEELPQADAIINPKLDKKRFPGQNLAGVAVVFYLMLGLRALLRQQHWFAENNLREPPMAPYLDLVALGTIADVVSFDYVNRLLVQQGLQRIRQGNCNVGIMALASLARCELETITAEDMAFKIAPRLNAAGRLDDMAKGVECLLSTQQSQALHYAKQLNEINEQRKTHQQVSSQQALARLEQQIDSAKVKTKCSICLVDQSWHPGIVGLIASKLKEGFNLPTIIFAPDNNSLKGSARSIAGIHIRDVLASICAKQPALIEKFGGHAMAAGLTIKSNDFQLFADSFEAAISHHLNGTINTAFELSDGELDAGHFHQNTVELIQNAGPWGVDFEKPKFDNVFEVGEYRSLGQNGEHLKFMLYLNGDHATAVHAVAFNVGRYLKSPPSDIKSIHAVYHLAINHYKNATNLQLIIDYFEILSTY